MQSVAFESLDVHGMRGLKESGNVRESSMGAKQAMQSQRLQSKCSQRATVQRKRYAQRSDGRDAGSTQSYLLALSLNAVQDGFEGRLRKAALEARLFIVLET